MFMLQGDDNPATCPRRYLRIANRSEVYLFHLIEPYFFCYRHVQHIPVVSLYTIKK